MYFWKALWTLPIRDIKDLSAINSSIRSRLNSSRLALTDNHRSQIIWRLDGGFGSDDHLNWLLRREYQFLAKGCSNRRSAKFVNEVKRWHYLNPTKLVGLVPTPREFVRDVQTLSIRYQTKKAWKHTYLFSTLNMSALATARFYDQRGGAETQFRTDKSGGLFLHKRRKHHRDPQEVWILLTDIAHNFLAWFAHHTINEESRIAARDS